MRYLQRETDQLIGKNIASTRKELGISQKQLAEKLEISARALWSYESGNRSIPIFLLPKLAEELHTSILKILNIEASVLDERTKEARILRELEKVKNLTAEEQKAIFTMIDSMCKKNI